MIPETALRYCFYAVTTRAPLVTQDVFDLVEQEDDEATNPWWVVSQRLIPIVTPLNERYGHNIEVNCRDIRDHEIEVEIITHFFSGVSEIEYEEALREARAVATAINADRLYGHYEMTDTLYSLEF